MTSSQQVAIRAEAPRALRAAAFHVVRSRAYSFVLDQRGLPIESARAGSRRRSSARSAGSSRRPTSAAQVVIKILQKGVSDEDHLRFQMEKELLERVQGHPNIVTLFASGEGEDPEFVPAPIREQVESEFVILERMEMSLEERLKGSRGKAKKEDLLALDMRERVFRVLDYIIPVASARRVRPPRPERVPPRHQAGEHPHPASPTRTCAARSLEVRLADFNVAKLHDTEIDFGDDARERSSVPGTQFFQSPEQETNVLELLVNTQQGSPEVEFFEDFYIHIAKNDTFSLFNRERVVPDPLRGPREEAPRSRPALPRHERDQRAREGAEERRPPGGHLLARRPLLLFRSPARSGTRRRSTTPSTRSSSTSGPTRSNTIEAYLEHEYAVIRQLAAPKPTEGEGVEVAPANRFFSYKHYLDGNGDLIDPFVMKIIAQVHDPEQAGQLLPGARGRDARHQQLRVGPDRPLFDLRRGHRGEARERRAARARAGGARRGRSTSRGSGSGGRR